MTRFHDLRAHNFGKVKRTYDKFGFGLSNCCYWCGCRIFYTGRQLDNQATREHLVPRAYGGGGGKNLLAACKRCNNHRKHSTDWVPWHELLKIEMQFPDFETQTGSPCRRCPAHNGNRCDICGGAGVISAIG